MTPKYIILHTAAYKGDADIEEIRRWHINRGWSDVGYHYYIRRDGEIQKGREETVRGAHARGMNTDSLGICFEGHGDYEPLTQEQRNALCDLYSGIESRWDIPPQHVSGHREFNEEKTCPGKKVDMDDIRNMLKMWLDIPNVSPPDNKFETVDPAELDSWDMSMPADYIEEVDEGKGLQRAKEIAEDAVNRSKWKRRGAIALNGAISLVARITRIPELNHLKLKTKRGNSMPNIDVSKKIQKIINADGWESLVWAAIAVGGVVSGYMTGEVSYIAGGLAVGIKSAFQWYKAKKDSEDE